MKSAFDKIAAGLADALAVARGEKEPARMLLVPNPTPRLVQIVSGTWVDPRDVAAVQASEIEIEIVFRTGMSISLDPPDTDDERLRLAAEIAWRVNQALESRPPREGSEPTNTGNRPDDDEDYSRGRDSL